MAGMKSSNSGPIQFRSERLQPRILVRDTSGKLNEVTVPIEVRFDPLTGQSCRLVEFSLQRIRRPDLSALVQRSLEMPCPFCMPLIEKATPRFPPEIVPEGTIRIGRAVAFPNARPYDVYGAVVVISDEHFIPLTEFTLETLVNALLAAQEYIVRVKRADAQVRFDFIAWNFLPPSGGSLVHPHIQCNAGYFPTFYQKQVLEACDKYHQATGRNFWSDLVEEERRRQERYIGTTGNACWLTAFAPRGRLMDVLTVFPGRSSITELSEEDFRQLATGLLNIFRYMDELNLVSFNLSTYSGTDSNRFWTHVRIIPRSLLLYTPIETNDHFYLQVLHDESVCLLSPEVACQELKKRFFPTA